MSTIFTLLPKFLQKIKPKPYYNNILLVFSQDNPLKIAIDDEGLAIDIYREIAEKNDDELVSTWLVLMGHDPSNFEPVGDISLNRDVSKLDFFLKICKEIVGKKQMIVQSRQDCKGLNVIGANTIKFENTNLKFFDRDEAIVLISQKISQFHSGGGDNVGGDKISY